MSKKSILCLLAENEDKIARLYDLYAEKIRGRKRFWRLMAEEEYGHGQMMRELDSRFGSNPEFLKVSKHARQIVSYISDYIDSEIKKVKKGHVSHAEALESALRIEQSMVETKSFEIFNPIAKPVAIAFRRLNRETKTHVNELRKMCKEY